MFVAYFVVLLTTSLIWSNSIAFEAPIYDFNIDNYSQNAQDYLSPRNKSYYKSLLKPDYQNLQLKYFYIHYFASDSNGLSPWNRQMIDVIVPLVNQVETAQLEEFNPSNPINQTKKHYGENFKLHDQKWWQTIRERMNLRALDSIMFKGENRAIAVNNTFARTFPDSAPDFFDPSLPGEGFPFDNLQQSAIWIGTPLYVLSLSTDRAWSLVLTPDGYFAWAKSSDIAYVSPDFIYRWQQSARRYMTAVTRTEASVNYPNQQFLSTVYIGAVFPMIKRNAQYTTILVPIKNNLNQAAIQHGQISTDDTSVMPLSASPKNFVKIINQLKNRPYGWGGSFFYNDCSQEIKSLFTPFGIWLPRNSAQQTKVASVLDLSTRDVDSRLKEVKKAGHPLTTLIYIDGHIMLYVGTQDIRDDNNTIITYQDVWGMVPTNKDKRYVVGQSLFLPLMKSYPENSAINSPANGPIFKLIYLDNLNSTPLSPKVFVNHFFNYNPLL